MSLSGEEHIAFERCTFHDVPLSEQFSKVSMRVQVVMTIMVVHASDKSQVALESVGRFWFDSRALRP